MAVITLKNFPDELHRKVKRRQLDLEDNGEAKTLEQIYIELINAGLEKSEGA